MPFLRPFLVVALSMTAPAAMAVTADEQTPVLVSADICDLPGAARCQAREANAAASPTPRATTASVSKVRKITRMPWMIGAFQ